jgi:glycosyltransferase involved in cell wall biosynthesis
MFPGQSQPRCAVRGADGPILTGASRHPHYTGDMPTPPKTSTSAPTRLRVSMLGSFPPQAQGIQMYCRGLGEALSRVCALDAIGFRRMYPAFLFPGVKENFDPGKPPMQGEDLRVSHPLAWYAPWGWLAAALRVRADVFHLQWWSLPLFPVAALFVLVMRLRGIPVVITVHNVLPHERSRGFVGAGRWLCRRAVRVLVHSAVNREQLIAHYGVPPERVVLVPHGSPAPEAMPERTAACARLGLRPERRYVLAFGVIRPYKGVGDLIDALARIAAPCPEVDLIVAGKPWVDWEPYAARIAAHGLDARVHTFLDYIPETALGDYFAVADLVALPYTHFDAQSGVGAQALPYGKPLLVSQTGALPEWVDHAPAWLVPPSSPAALAERLQWVFADWAAARAAFAPVAARVLARHGWDVAAAAHVAVYAQAVAPTDRTTVPEC